MPIERQSEQWPHRCAALSRVAVDWSQPKHLNTPLHTPAFRPEFYHRQEWTDRHHFNAEDFNPPGDSPARPTVRWKSTAPEQPTLDLDTPRYFSPGTRSDVADALGNLGQEGGGSQVYPVDRKPQMLHRLVNLDMDHPDMRPVRRALFGDDNYGKGFSPRPDDQHALFPVTDEMVQGDPEGFNNKNLGHAILDHVSNHPDYQGMGTHWSTSEEMSKEFNSFSGSNRIPAVISAEWMGRGEDPYRTDTGGNYPGEQEITMMRGAPMRVTNVRIQHPETEQWHSVFSGPKQDRTAALEPDPQQEAELEPDEDSYCKNCGPDDPEWCKECGACDTCDASHDTHCSSCGPNDSDWCEDCQQCNHCDAADHEKHCSYCGPNDSDWCASCEECANCDSHDTHCSSCGPNDSDWCESCQQCSYCDSSHEEHCSYCGPDDYNWCEACNNCKSCGGCECGTDAGPVGLNTPLFRRDERPESYSSVSGQNEYYFSPREINPASEAASRPYVNFPAPEDEDPTLDFGKPLSHSNGIDSIPAGTPGLKLFRGLTVDLNHPDLHELRRSIWGPQQESYYSGDPASQQPVRQRWMPRRPVQPGMFPGPFSNKELAAPPADPDRLHRHLNTLLDHIEDHERYRDVGLGRHWSTEFDQAKSFSGQYSTHDAKYGRLPVMLKARWRGQGENPYRHETGESHPGEYEHENEMNLLPGAPVKLTDVMVYHPQTKQWHSIMDIPQRRHAGWFR